ncbi:UNVERIFIED_ORG: 3-hydroxyisobutyrate dehydrogenase, partial [Martelella mediterranea]
MANVAFLGLGVMGYPMAGHLASKGHDVTVYNRTAAKARKWSEEKGGASASTPAAAASEK